MGAESALENLWPVLLINRMAQWSCDICGPAASAFTPMPGSGKGSGSSLSTLEPDGKQFRSGHRRFAGEAVYRETDADPDRSLYVGWQVNILV